MTRVVLFCGGSGSRTLVERFSRDPDIALTLIVNCFDDGLSTGLLRVFVPRMLGPSDVRKNLAHILRGKRNEESFADMLGFRLDRNSGQDYIRHIVLRHLERERLDGDRSRNTVETSLSLLDSFFKYRSRVCKNIDLGGVALGNILFTGMYLQCGQDFNLTVKRFTEYVGVDTKILNVTDGADLKLIALTDENEFLKNEAAISFLSGGKMIEELFLVSNYLTVAEYKKIVRHNKAENKMALQRLSRLPNCNLDALAEIRNADVIVYGPGTQHSSLFPSYMTKGLVEAIAGSKARKIFICNICRDCDIERENVALILGKFFWYMSRKGEYSINTSKCVSDILVHQSGGDRNDRYLEHGDLSNLFAEAFFHIDNWADRDDLHDAAKVWAYIEEKIIC